MPKSIGIYHCSWASPRATIVSPFQGFIYDWLSLNRKAIYVFEDNLKSKSKKSHPNSNAIKMAFQYFIVILSDLSSKLYRLPTG